MLNKSRLCNILNKRGARFLFLLVLVLLKNLHSRNNSKEAALPDTQIVYSVMIEYLSGGLIFRIPLAALLCERAFMHKFELSQYHIVPFLLECRLYGLRRFFN